MPTPEPTPAATPEPTPTPGPTPTVAPARQQAWAPAAFWTLAAGFGSGIENGAADAPGGTLGDGLPVASAYLSKPTNVAFLPDGRGLVLDRGHGVIRVDNHGVAATWAGQVLGTPAAPGVPVNQAEVRLLGTTASALPAEVAVSPDGSVWVVDGAGQLLLMPVASGRAYGLDLEAGKAHVVPLPAELGKPNGLSAAPDGTLVFTVVNQNKASITAHRYLYRLNLDGSVVVLAGSGSATGLIGEEGALLAEAPIAGPSAPHVDPDGNVWFSEVSTQLLTQQDSTTQSVSVARIMLVCLQDIEGFGGRRTAGRVYPMIGAGPRTPYSASTDVKSQVDQGDGLPGLQASVFKASSMAVTPEGHLVFLEPTLARLRLFDRNTGLVHRLAGPGPATEPDGPVPLAEGRLALPTYLAVDATGDILITDFSANRVRRVKTAP